MRINCILCIKQERRTKSKEVVWVRVKKRNKCQHKVVNVRGRCKNTQMWHLWTGQRRIILPAWYKRYCTAGAWKLRYHAARTVHAYDTVVTHQQQEKKQSPNSSWSNHKQQDNNAQTHMEQDSGTARSWEGKEGGRQGSLRKEVVINVEFAKQTNVTPWWMQPGQRHIVVPAWYEW